MPRPPIPDDQRCTATTTKGVRCRCRRVEGLPECEVHSDAFGDFDAWLRLDLPVGSSSGVTQFDLDRATWAGARR